MAPMVSMASATPAWVLPGALRSALPSEQQSNPCVIWCEAKISETSSKWLKQSHLPSLHFRAHVHFCRWLFDQPRGGVEPWAALVCPWREAKPCAAAIRAAATGDTERLRSDLRRPALPATAQKAGGKAAKVAIRKMIIIVDTPEQEVRALAWIASEQVVPTWIARSVSEVGYLLYDARVVKAADQKAWCAPSVAPKDELAQLSGQPPHSTRGLIKEVALFGLPHEALKQNAVNDLNEPWIVSPCLLSRPSQ
mmetsp:Transcript_88002/g.249313  ORF Transcript_88002/g.249313 Transcript_88002/m.249313 type:complete len:252 (+) Transcript_88002:77-832(+)